MEQGNLIITAEMIMSLDNISNYEKNIVIDKYNLDIKSRKYNDLYSYPCSISVEYPSVDIELIRKYKEYTFINTDMLKEIIDKEDEVYYGIYGDSEYNSYSETYEELLELKLPFHINFNDVGSIYIIRYINNTRFIIRVTDDDIIVSNEDIYNILPKITDEEKNSINLYEIMKLV